MVRLLAERESSGVHVRLFWDGAARSCDPAIVVEYEDRNEDVVYTLYPPPEHALDGFYPPTAYRDRTRSWTRYSVRV